MKIAIGSDHGGFELKGLLAAELNQAGHRVLDLGARDAKPSDYPDFACKVSAAVLAGRAARGVILCGSGVGAAIAANKIPGIRAGLCHDTYSARQCVEHDDANVLCLGARVVGSALALEVVDAFLGAKFSGEERHRRRLDKVLAIEAEFSKAGLRA